MRKKLNSKGFTLIELLIVIIIIGILAAIAFVAYNGSQNRAHKASAQSTLSEVKNKLGEYNADHSSYPASMTDLKSWLGSKDGGNNTALVKTLTDGGENYVYAVDDGDSGTECGDTVSSTDGTVTAGTTSCAGFSLTAKGALWNSGSESEKVTN